MYIYLVRHGEASHLKEDWKKIKFNRHEFMEKMIAWNNAELTAKGIQDLYDLRTKLPLDGQLIFSSPLKRSLETAKYLVGSENKVIISENLKEIVTNPLKVFDFKKFSTLTWIYFCVFSCFFNGFVFKVIKGALAIFYQAQQLGSDTVMVSHAMRIRSLVYMSYFLPGIKTVKKEFTPGGVTIIKIKELFQARAQNEASTS